MTITGSQPAYLDALFNVARFGASRFGAFSSRAFISIGGVPITDARDDAWDPGILRGSLTVQDLLDDRPNTASFSAWNFKPALGSEVLITLGSKHNHTRVFAGYVLDVNQVYLSKPVNRVFHVSCIDYTWRLMQTKAYGFYQNASATTIVRDLLARFAPTVSDRYVQAGLPTVAELTITNEDLPAVFKRIAQRVGAYFYVDYGAALHFYTTEAKQNPRDLTPDHPSLSAVEHERDLSQVITRVLSEGGGGNTLAPVAVGAAVIPVDVASWYAAAGGYATIGPNRVQYTGLQGSDGSGSLIGPGVTPAEPPRATLKDGGTLTIGTYQYAYSFQTAAGETRPSPAATQITQSAFQWRPAVTAPGVRYSSTGGGVPLSAGAAYQYAYTYSPIPPTGLMTGSSANQTALSPASAVIVCDGSRGHDVLVDYEGLSQGGIGAKAAYFYRSVNGGAWKLFRIMPVAGGNFQSPIYDYYQSDADIAGNMSPPADSSGAVSPAKQQIELTFLATGPAGVTNRKLYRTAVNGSQLKLLATFAGNVSTGPYTDTAADASLGANAPTGDTSGLQVAANQVNPGATTIIVAGTAWANPSGGWAVIGNGRQVIRYSGTTAGSLTGVPATGVGSVVGAVPYNSSITAAPLLTGVPATGDGAVRWAVPEGQPVNVLAVLDDPAAQDVIRSFVPGHSGVVEEYVADGRLSLAEATARGAALLRAKAAPLVTLRYNSRDVTTQSGATVTAALPPPTDIHETLKIQSVTIDGFNISPKTNAPPSYHATASSDRYSLEDLLRQIKGPQ